MTILFHDNLVSLMFVFKNDCLHSMIFFAKNGKYLNVLQEYFNKYRLKPLH